MKCFLCDRPAFFVSVNTQRPRCEYQVAKCPGLISKAKTKRYSTLSKEDLKTRMEAIGVKGRAAIAILQSDSDFVESRNLAISEGIKAAGGRIAERNANFGKSHKPESRLLMQQKAKARSKEFYERNIQTRLANGHITPIESKPEFTAYKQQVAKVTRRYWLSHHSIINPLGHIRGSEYELDHLFSITDGFNNGISPEIIGHWVNLKLIPKAENRSKHSRSDISIDDLLNKYNKNK